MDRRVVALMFVAFFLRMAFCASTAGVGRNMPVEEHYREYITVATRLVEHGTVTSPLSDDPGFLTPSSLMPPLYAFLVAALYATFGIESFSATLILQLLNAAAPALASGLAFSIVKRLGGGTGGAWLAAVLVAVNPLLIRFTTFVWDSNLFILAATFSAWSALRLGEFAARPVTWFAFGVLLGLVALLNPALTITYPLLVLWPAVRSRGWRWDRLLGAIALTVLGWGITIAPWTIRNFVQFERLIYVRSGFWLEMWLGVCAEAEHRNVNLFRTRFPLLNDEVEAHVLQVGETRYLEECREQARAAIQADPWRLVRLIGVRCVDYAAGTVFTHAVAGESGWPRSRTRGLAAAFVLAEAALLILGMLFRRSVPAGTWWLVSIIAAFSLVYCLTHVQLRYRAPIEPLVAAALGLFLTGRGAPRPGADPGRGPERLV